MNRRRAVLLCLLALCACHQAEPVRIDGSSQSAFERTAREARDELPAADQLEFDRALRTIGGRRFANRDPAALARVTFDNMTGADIVADQKQRDR